MSETDRQTDTTAKSTRWAFTAYVDQWSLFKTMPHDIAEWGWQEEICPETSRHHYQGYLRTKQQVRFSQLQKLLPGVHIEPSRDWNKLKQYCQKPDTAVEGSQRHEVSQTHNVYSCALMIAQSLPSVESMKQEYELLRENIRKNSVRGEMPLYESNHCESWESYMLHQVEMEVKTRVREGNTELVWIGINPQWICMWKKYGEDYLIGAKKSIV